MAPMEAQIDQLGAQRCQLEAQIGQFRAQNGNIFENTIFFKVPVGHTDSTNLAKLSPKFAPLNPSEPKVGLSEPQVSHYEP